MTTVVNIKTNPTHTVYIGRGSFWGNSWSHLPYTQASFRVSNRTEAIMKYRESLKQHPELVAKIRTELKGQVLGCFCKPDLCHGDILARVADGGDV